MNDVSRPGQIDLARETAFRLGAIEIRPATREVVIGDMREMLEPRIMQVLVALARRGGGVVSRDDLIMTCWAGRVVGDDAINRCIARIRRLAETHGGFSLETIPRVGYRLTARDCEAEIPLPAPGAPLGVMPPAAKTLSRRSLLAAAVLLFAAAFGLAYWMLAPAVGPAKEIAVRPPARLSIAILPFTPLYTGPDAQHVGDSIASSVADMLSSSAFDVISPTRSFQFRGAAKAGAAQALHADFLIDGEVRSERGKIVVSIRLIEGSSGTTVVAGTIERPASETADVPEQVAAGLTELGWIVARGFTGSPRSDAHIVAACLRTMYQYWARNDPYAATDMARSVAKAAPNNALAQFVHALMAAYLVEAISADKKAGILAEARHAANKAIRLDPSYGDPYIVLSLTTPTFDWATREDYLRRGFALRPDLQISQSYLTDFLQNSGQFRDAAPLAESAYTRAPYEKDVIIKTINARLWLGHAGGPASHRARAQAVAK